MRRRTFLAALPAAALATGALAQSRPTNPNLNRPDVHGGDRIDGATFASRSAAWGVHGAAATAHPLASLAAIDTLRKGGSAIDAAIAANACLGFLEPISCGIGGDCFVMLWDPKTRKVVGLNGSGRSPKALTLETQRARSKNGRIASFGAISVSVPGAIQAWWDLHQRFGKLPWKDLFDPAIAYAEEGVINFRKEFSCLRKMMAITGVATEVDSYFRGLKDESTPKPQVHVREPPAAPVAGGQVGDFEAK